jgi:hypothetical protein
MHGEGGAFMLKFEDDKAIVGTLWFEYYVGEGRMKV